jgi:2-polyprenyl-6-methoxyphenol hydroxylase-like FAD-dependent oxidoreductase
LDTPVLIIGAGPTGLTLAIALRLHGVDVRLIDRAPAPANVSKALAVWSGSLEALAGLGMIDAFLASGRRLKALTLGDGPRRLARLAAGDGIDSPYPFPLLLPQSRTEAILGARAAELGVTVERGLELTALTQDAAGVAARLRRADGSEEIAYARYLVGADGARSRVRQCLGIEFEGYTEPQSFILGDLEIEGDLDPDSIYIWWHGGGTVAFFPFETNRWRVFAARADAADETPLTVEELQAQVDRHGPAGLRLANPAWLSVFRTNERLAAHYRAGGVFLAGDAAHIHSPAGGQGMNTGIQDATNLAWKLAHVLQGKGDAALLLDSYEAERRPIARAVIAGAAQKLHFAFAGGLLARMARDLAVTIAGNLPAIQKALQVEMSETEIIYRDGTLVALGAPPRRPRRTDVGTRARDGEFVDPASGAAATLWPRLNPIGHTLLVFDGPGQAMPLDGIDGRRGADLAVLRFAPSADPGGKLRARYHLPAPGWVLIRPDQVVAARGDDGGVASLTKYLDHVIGSKPAA